MSTVIAKSRHASRHRTFKDGLIVFALAPPVFCLIRNLSETGAALEVERPGDIPDEFSLLIKPEFVWRKCRVAWRVAKHIGIQFVRSRPKSIVKFDNSQVARRRAGVMPSY